LSSDIDPDNNGLVIENYYNFENAKDKIASVNRLTETRKIRCIRCLEFDFDKFLFLEITARNDWSSTLTKQIVLISTLEQVYHGYLVNIFQMQPKKHLTMVNYVQALLQ
jgi:hypothetical protein